MIFGGASLGATAFACCTPLAASVADTFSTYPFRTLLRGVHVQDFVVPGVTGDEALGEVATATVTFVNPDDPPQVGDPVEFRYFSHVLFSGTITEIERTIDLSHDVTEYACTVTDWAQVLVRRKVRRSFTDLTLPQLVSSLLENELVGDGFTYGSSENPGLMELVDADNVSAFDVLRDVAGITGQVLIVETDKTIRFVSTSNGTAPFDVKDATAQDVKDRVDRETYRNVQTVIAKGTPPQGVDAIEVQVILTNDMQIAERQSIEGGSGRYESIDEVTHPSSNTQAIVARLADTYAQVLLAVSGTPRTTLSVKMKPIGLYGFRAGQVAPVDLSAQGIVGTWLIQKASWTEQDGSRLVYSLQLVQSSLQQRAWESWASIFRAGKLVVSVPGNALSANIASFTSAGSFQWVSPIAGTITITTIAGSGGGGGAARFASGNVDFAKGGKGGASGKTVTALDVAIGDVLDIVVGAAGVGGTGTNGTTLPRTSTAGTAGGDSTVSRTGVLVSRAYGGGGGKGKTITGGGLGCTVETAGANGAAGGGSDGIVTVGGGVAGGAQGSASCTTTATSGGVGNAGSVTIEY